MLARLSVVPLRRVEKRRCFGCGLALARLVRQMRLERTPEEVAPLLDNAQRGCSSACSEGADWTIVRRFILAGESALGEHAQRLGLGALFQSCLLWVDLVISQYLTMIERKPDSQ